MPRTKKKAVKPIKKKVVRQPKKKVVTTSLANKTGEIRFADVLRAVDKLKAQGTDPIEGIEVGKNLFKELKSKSTAKRVGSLYGVRIIENSFLLPNQYRILKHGTR